MATRGWQDVTMADVTKRELARQRVRMPKAKRSKYNAVKTTVDGIVFDSKREAARYQELLALGAAGEVRNLELQPSFAIRIRANDAPVSLIVARYVADFRYQRLVGVDTVHGRNAWADCVEDVKGMKTPVYRLKKKLVEAQYGITIKEV